MIILEVSIDHPIFREPLDQVPDIEIVWEHTWNQQDGPTYMIVWIQSDDFDAVDNAIAADPGVRNPRILTDLGSRRLYQVEQTERGRSASLLPELAAAGGVIREAIGTNAGWFCRMHVPTQSVIDRIMQFSREQDFQITVLRRYEEARHEMSTSAGLTEAQEAILNAAVTSGYLEIPRQCTLAELGATLDISESAASERFRRGVKQLIHDTMLD